MEFYLIKYCPDLLLELIAFMAAGGLIYYLFIFIAGCLIAWVIYELLKPKKHTSIKLPFVYFYAPMPTIVETPSKKLHATKLMLHSHNKIIASMPPPETIRQLHQAIFFENSCGRGGSKAVIWLKETLAEAEAMMMERKN